MPRTKREIAQDLEEEISRLIVRVAELRRHVHPINVMHGRVESTLSNLISIQIILQGIVNGSMPDIFIIYDEDVI